MDSKYQRKSREEAQGPYRLSSVVIPDSTSGSRLISGKSVVSKCCTLIETAVGLDPDLLAVPPCPRRNGGRLNEFDLSLNDRSRTWSRVFNLKVAGVNGWLREAH